MAERFLPLMLNAPASILQGTLLSLALPCWPVRKRRCQFKNEVVIEKMGEKMAFCHGEVRRSPRSNRRVVVEELWAETR
ncbi:hypothetical protein NC651_036159 [Populus alba x Populus x berolinensis]|nr:hypothetical protein NC651_036159 [Populus alba x Populus x berolinensis]